MRTLAPKHWPILLGLAALILPSFVTLGTQSWTREQGAQGPSILAVGIWLLSRSGVPAKSDQASVLLAAAFMLFLLGYVVGRAYFMASLEIAALFGILLTIAAIYFGLPELRRRWFPTLFLAFLIPIPDALLNRLTGPLKVMLSWAATTLLAHLHYPVAHEGVVIYVAQYQLLVEDACSGLNSLISLIALGLFYIHVLSRASWRYSALLVLLILPIALITNFIRILTLVLLTYYDGDALAQGVLHQTAGMLVFIFALGLIILIDRGLQRFSGRVG